MRRLARELGGCWEPVWLARELDGELDGCWVAASPSQGVGQGLYKRSWLSVSLSPMSAPCGQVGLELAVESATAAGAGCGLSDGCG